MLPRQARDKIKKAEKKVFAAGIVIRSNVLTRCTDSAGLVAEPGEKTPLLRHFILNIIILPRQARGKHREISKKRHFLTGVQLVNVQNNNIWLTGKGGGLKELTQPRLSQQLNQYYEGVNQSAAFRNRPPQDLHEDPEIVSFIESEPGFLCVAAGSTSAAARIGGCTAPAPTLAGATAWQGVLNGDFSAGMWAWQGHSFPDNPGATRLPIWHRDSTTWSVVADGCAKGKSPCARIQTKTIANGTVASTRFRSSAFDITRTRHGMNLRCAHKRFRSPSF